MKKLMLIIFSVLFTAALAMAGNLPDYQKLCAKLIDLKGWQAQQCEGVNITGSPMGEIVSAHRSYVKGNQELEISIFSGMQAMAYWSPFKSNLQVKTSEGFFKSTKINGFPVGVSYHQPDKSGGIVVCLNLVNGQQCQAVFILNFNGMDWQDALELAKKFDLKGMSELFNKK